MDSPAKPAPASGLLARLLLFGVLVLVLRFAYIAIVFSFSSADPFAFASDSSSSPPPPIERDLWATRDYREAVDFYSAGFQALAAEGFLSSDSKSLCVGSAYGHEVLALKEIGVPDAIGISRARAPPLVVGGNVLRQPFRNGTFDFVFAAAKIVDRFPRPVDLAREMARTLKPEGFLVIHTASAGDAYSLQSLLGLFTSCRLIRSREIEDQDSSKKLREIILQKLIDSEAGNSNPGDKCSALEQKLRIVSSAEPLIEEEPLKPWITLKKNINNVKYLPSMADISFKRRYVYIDVGARSYSSSIGSWFKKQYPKQNQSFEIYAIEADRAFYEEYATKKGVNLLPYAAWVRNETLIFEINRDPDQKIEDKGVGRGMGRIRPAGGSSRGSSSDNVHAIQGFDLAEWLRKTVSENDFVVMKMDVEGTEFDLVPRLFKTGTICLIDELFLECHYNRWQRCCPGERSPKYKKTYGQCLELFTSLRDRGVLVHQWW